MKVQNVTLGVETEAPRPAPVPVQPRTEQAKPPVAPPAAVKEGGPAPDRPGDREKLAEQIQRYLQQNRSSLDISLDKDLHMIVTKVLEGDSGAVKRQYPPEEIIAVMKYLREQRGVLVNRKG
jgi:uncharacterized FlaG/YvyC family protein